MALGASAISDQEARAAPWAIAVLFALCGIGLALSAARSTGGEKVEWPDRGGWRRLAVVVLASALFVASLRGLGFPLASASMVGGLALYLGRGWPSALLAGMVTGAAIYVGFIKLLGLALPAGPLP